MLIKFLDWYLPLRDTLGHTIFVWVYAFFLGRYIIRMGEAFGKVRNWKTFLVMELIVFISFCFGVIWVNFLESYVQDYYYPLKEMESNLQDQKVPDLTTPVEKTPTKDPYPLDEEYNWKKELANIIIPFAIALIFYVGRPNN